MRSYLWSIHDKLAIYVPHVVLHCIDLLIEVFHHTHFKLALQRLFESLDVIVIAGPFPLL